MGNDSKIYKEAQEASPAVKTTVQIPTRSVKEVEDFIIELHRAALVNGGCVPQHYANKLNDMLHITMAPTIEKFRNKERSKVDTNQNKVALGIWGSIISNCNIYI